MSAVTVGALSNTPYAYGFGRVGWNGTTYSIAVTLAGTSLRTTAQGANYKLIVYDATPYDIDGTAQVYKPRVEIPLEATGTATAISASGHYEFDVQFALDNYQAYALLTVDGVPVWWGLVNAS